jgi:hypothetical protein
MDRVALFVQDKTRQKKFLCGAFQNGFFQNDEWDFPKL